MQLKKTDQAAQELGVTHDNLRAYINRHPQLKPRTALHKNLYLWTDLEIAAVREARRAGAHRARRRKS